MTFLTANWDAAADLLTLSRELGGDDAIVQLGCEHDPPEGNSKARQVGILAEYPQSIPGYGWQPRATLMISHDRAGEIRRIEARGLATMLQKYRARFAVSDSVLGLRMPPQSSQLEGELPDASYLRVDCVQARVEQPTTIKAGWYQMVISLLPSADRVEPWHELYAECDRCFSGDDRSSGFFGIQVDMVGRLTGILLNLPEDHALLRRLR